MKWFPFLSETSLKAELCFNFRVCCVSVVTSQLDVKNSPVAPTLLNGFGATSVDWESLGIGNPSIKQTKFIERIATGLLYWMANDGLK